MTSHAQLVERAARWLRKSLGCRVVLAEPSGGYEVPDAIGWRNWQDSHVVECKASRADFLADRKKLWRLMGADALGYFRWYLAPPGIITVDDLPPRWGLLELRGDRVFKVRRAAPWKLDRPGTVIKVSRELELLLSELAKFQIVMGGGSLLPSRAGRRVEEAVRGMAAGTTWSPDAGPST